MAFSKIIAESMDLTDTYAFTGTVTGAGGGNNKPTFYAYQNSTQGSIADVTQTKITFQAELFDADGVYDTSNSKFTAPSAGKYFFHCAINNAYFYSTTGWQLNLDFFNYCPPLFLLCTLDK